MSVEILFHSIPTISIYHTFKEVVLGPKEIYLTNVSHIVLLAYAGVELFPFLDGG